MQSCMQVMDENFWLESYSSKKGWNLSFIVEKIWSISSITNMWQVYTRPTSASDFFFWFFFFFDLFNDQQSSSLQLIY
jgi:hypothetical protein